MYKNMLVALDGSERSYKALEHAVAIAEKFGSELTILTVVPKMVFPVFPHEDFGTFPMTAIKNIYHAQDCIKAFYQDVLTHAEAKVRLEHADLSISTILMEGRPLDSIVDVAEKGGYDLVIMGSRRMSSITSRIFGSTSRDVVDSCKKPVLIII